MDPAEVAQHRTALMLEDEPDGAQTVLDVRAAMYGEEPAEHAEQDHANEHADEAGETAEEAESGDAEEHAHEEGEEHGHDHADHDHADHEHAHGDHAHEHELAEAKEPKLSELDVVLVGMVGGVPNPSQQSHPDYPFVENQAMFFLADPEAVAELEEHAHHHAPGEECAFCAAHAPNALVAVVQFKGKNGKPLRVGARELFDLKEKETVVVRGKARIAPGGMLTVDATGLYARR
jgi:hypothetical protein